MQEESRVDGRRFRDMVSPAAFRELVQSIEGLDQRVGVEYTDTERKAILRVMGEKEKVFVRDKEFRTVFHRIKRGLGSYEL